LNATPINIQPPHDADVERGVLGACMAWPELLEPVLAACCPDDFYDVTNAAIAGAVVAVHAEAVPVTPLTVATKLPNARAGAGMSIREYLDAITETAPALGVVALARSIADMRIRREGIAAAQEVIEGLSHPAMGVLDAVRPLQEVAERAATMIGKRQVVPVREAADAMLRNASDRAAGRAVVAATTGVNILDEAIGGLQGGDMIVYAGRPGMGKSALLMSTALRAAMEGRPSLFFSLEMTQERLLQRIGCDLDFDQNPSQPLSYSWFRNGTAKHDDIGRLGEALKRLPDGLVIYENGSLDIHEIAALSRAHAAKSNVMGVVVIDYLQKVSAGDRYKGNRVQEVTEISGAAKALAMRLKWPVIVGAQLNRGVESREEKRPNLTDLRESGSIEQDADAVIGLYRPAYYIDKRKPAQGPADPAYAAWKDEWDQEQNRIDLLVLKNRNGAEDSFSVFCDMRASAIRSDAPNTRPR
jgi:replicative DNA helicase